MAMRSLGSLDARSNCVQRTRESSRRPGPVPNGNPGLAFDCASACSFDRAGAGDSSAYGGAPDWSARGDAGAVTAGCVISTLRLKSATPITPTLDGRPVRAAYESPRDVK